MCDKNIQIKTDLLILGHWSLLLFAFFKQIQIPDVPTRLVFHNYEYTRNHRQHDCLLNSLLG